MRQLAVVAMVASIVAGCASYEPAIPPSIALANVELVRPGLLRQDLVLDLRIGNPNNFDIPIDGLTFRLDIDGQPFAEGYSNQRLTVPRLSEVSIPVAATTDTFAIVRQIMSLGDRQEIRYRMHGYAYIAELAGSRRIPYEREGTLSLDPGTRRPAPGITPDRLLLVPL
jgi:LEA14-like dessication related protein